MPGETSSRDRLLDAAVRTIEAHGEAAVRVREVAGEAGVAYTSVYHFFGDREGLVQAAHVERYRRTLFLGLDELDERVATCSTRDGFRTIVTEMLAHVFDPERAEFRLARTNALGSALDRPDLAAKFAALHDQFDRRLASAMRVPQQRGWIRPGLDLRMLAAWYRGQVSSRVHIELAGPRPEHVFWNKFTLEAVLAVAMGVAPDPLG